MDQKDANIQNTEQKQAEEIHEEIHKVKKLASAAELRGSRSGSPADGKGKKNSGKMWMSLLAMVIVLGVAIGVYIAASEFKPQEEEQNEVNETLAPTTTYKMVSRQRAEITSVTVQLEGEEPYTITNTVNVSGEGENAVTAYKYGIQGIPSFNLNESLAGSIIGYAANLSVTELIAENVTDFSPYGLDDPAIIFTMNYSNGSQDVLLFGKKVPTDSRYYVCRQGEQTVYVVYNSAYETLHTTLNELAVVSMPVVISDASTIVNFLVEQKGKETVEVSYDAESSSTFSIGTMKLVQPVQYDTDSDRISQILESIAGLTITGYAGEKSLMPEAGLDDPRAKIRVTDIDGNVLNYTVGNYKDDSSIYVQVDDSETVYLADASTLNFLNNVTVNYLIDQFTNLVNILRVDELTVMAGENAYIMSIAREPDVDASGNQKTDSQGNVQTVDSYYFDGSVVTEDQFKEMYISLIGISMSKVSDNYQIEGEVAVQISFTLNVEPYEFVVEFLEYDDQYYAARRDGRTVALVKHEHVNSILEQLEAFRSSNIDAD